MWNVNNRIAVYFGSHALPWHSEMNPPKRKHSSLATIPSWRFEIRNLGIMTNIMEELKPVKKVLALFWRISIQKPANRFGHMRMSWNFIYLRIFGIFLKIYRINSVRINFSILLPQNLQILIETYISNPTEQDWRAPISVLECVRTTDLANIKCFAKSYIHFWRHTF